MAWHDALHRTIEISCCGVRGGRTSRNSLTVGVDRSDYLLVCNTCNLVPGQYKLLFSIYIKINTPSSNLSTAQLTMATGKRSEQQSNTDATGDVSLQPPADGISSLAWSPDSRRLLVGSWDSVRRACNIVDHRRSNSTRLPHRQHLPRCSRSRGQSWQSPSDLHPTSRSPAAWTGAFGSTSTPVTLY